ncbi:Stp1/IreP family PP2C-type Ser/Thr phosphatase [Brevibacillus sp. SYSU BS000544]|uniref:Stp1/IreP family PP2C-type Ser/Thr phosphatase n=1 Tax=Brevibacillus sp. SYSU BS000544 TaxID=3416443 RepID=UPI003CE56F79
MEIAMKTHIGCVRQINEDYFAYVIDLQGRVLAIVADGMGGHQAGDVASKMAVERILAEFRDTQDELSKEDEREKLMNAILSANQEVFRYAEDHPECNGMGTTVVAAIVGEDSGSIAHIGDSRMYLFVNGVLTQRTEDHSLVQELLRNGQITEQEAIHHPQRNVLMRALGTEESVLIELGEFAWSQGDVVLLCSDGLSNKVPIAVMEKWLKEPLSLQEQVDALIQHALDAGGEDNITCVAVRNIPMPSDVSRKEG